MSEIKYKKPKKFRPYEPEIIDQQCRHDICSYCYAVGPTLEYYIHYPAVAARCLHHVELHNLCQKCINEIKDNLDTSNNPVWESDPVPYIYIEKAKMDKMEMEAD